MEFFYAKPFDQSIADGWHAIDRRYKTAFLIVFVVNLLAFGFEMSNLTVHHDDVRQVFIQDANYGLYLGRFGFGALIYYTQNAYIMPFLQMLESVILMTFYGLLISHFWGVKSTFNIVLVSAILCVFPYIAQVYQYNTSMATYPLAYLLSALAVVLSTRANLTYIFSASLLYLAAFSIYQSVLANAAAIFIFWALARIMSAEHPLRTTVKALVAPTIAAITAVFAGGLFYIASVYLMKLDISSYQGASNAFSLSDGLNLDYAITEILKGSRAFYFWPENYFPDYLKKLQLFFLFAAGLLCFFMPKTLGSKSLSLFIFVLALFSPRLLQVLHPDGHYHALTLTAYSIVIAGCLMIIQMSRQIVLKNISLVFCLVLIAGYIIQCNWVSTVNYLNTLAHYSTTTQLISTVRANADKGWDGKKIVIVGSYDMPSAYPFKPATGVATEYIDMNEDHLQNLAKLMREDVTFIKADETTPEALQFASTHPAWPHPQSIGVVNGMGVVVLSKP